MLAEEDFLKYVVFQATQKLILYLNVCRTWLGNMLRFIGMECKPGTKGRFLRFVEQEGYDLSILNNKNPDRRTIPYKLKSCLECFNFSL